MLGAALRLPGDAVVGAALGDLTFPFARAEPDLFAPRDAPVVPGLHAEHAMHELGELLEIRPRLVGLLHRHRDVGPALNRQAPGLLAAATTATAADGRCHLAREPTAALQLLGRLLADRCGLVASLVLEPREHLPAPENLNSCDNVTFLPNFPTLVLGIDPTKMMLVREIVA